MATTKSTTKKATSKKTATKRTAAKKSSAAKAPAKKSTTKQAQSAETERPAKKSAPRKRASSAEGRATRDSSSRSRSSAPRAAAGKKRTGMQIAQEAARQLLELTGREAEGVVAMERTDDGWRIEVEVVEVRRIPDTTDVLALYEVTVDEDGDMEGYRRLRRYGRGVPGEERDR
jgi:hypothetical protein